MRISASHILLAEVRA